MNIQGLAIIAIIIILPMSIILSVYATNQIQTLNLQISYDSKLKSATYDGIKAFHLNMSNSGTSDMVNSKIRDINASIATFYDSLASGFNMSGYREDVLKNYVPAVVYTLYDGYYIYSAYENTLDEKDIFYDEATYKDGEEIYGLKPYIYYSCRYKKDSEYDVVITYTLDSYITIQGVVGDKAVNESGYLLTGVEKVNDKYTYKGIEITEENNKEGLIQNVYVPNSQGPGERITVSDDTVEYEVGRIEQYPYKKINGVKYYKDSDNSVFSIINDVKFPLLEANSEIITNNDNGIKYYKEAYEFKNKIKELGLENLNTKYAVDANGNSYNDRNIYEKEDDPYQQDINIFEELYATGEDYIEDKNSNFSIHKTQVIKNVIETNLIVAISNYNNVSTSGVKFAMPKLKEYEWETITNNITMISFLQGLSIGGKIYSGYAIVENNKTEDYVSENSIYILNNGTYYKATDPKILDSNLDNAVGVLNIDFDRRTAVASYKNDGIDLSKNVYYYPRKDMASYSSIINPNNNENSSISIEEYLKNASSERI